jgi:hypothetical protein
MSGWSNDQPRNLTIPADAGPNDPRTVIGSDVPAELVTYYHVGGPATFIAPETVVDVTINYDGRGNYVYQAVVIDSSASPVTSLAIGSNIAGTVTEMHRDTLNPSGGGSANTFYEHNKITAHTGSVADLNFAVFAASQGTDINADRLQLVADGSLRAGPGGTNQATDSRFFRAGVAFWAANDIGWYNSSAGAVETWHDATLQNGWTNRGAGFPKAGYKRMVTDSTVMLCGQIVPGTLLDNTILFNVPATYRPTTKIAFAVAGAAGQPAAIMNVATNGDVTILNGAAVTALQFSHVYPIDR